MLNLTWQAKANTLISEMCMTAYRQSNTLSTGERRKRHVPYTVPTNAQALVDCLKANDEHRAKGIFMYLRDTPEAMTE